MNSRYIRTHRSPLPKKKRSEELYGSFEDSGKYIKCWNCGSVIDVTRNISGIGNGVRHEDFPIEDLDIRSSGEPKDIVLTMDTLNMEGVILENGADGNPITDYYTPRKSVALGGCWLCGTKNLP
jgi:hypothetical protein